MNKKVRTVLYLLVVSVLLTLPTVFSYMIKQTGVVQNQLEVIHVECDIEETVVENVKTKISVKLKPMNSYERRIIHEKLADWRDVYTESEGSGEERAIVIKAKVQ